MKDKPIDPCKECLVRACCSDTCEPLRTYLKDVIIYLADHAEDDILDGFSSYQKNKLKATAQTAKAMGKVILQDVFRKDEEV